MSRTLVIVALVLGFCCALPSCCSHDEGKPIVRPDPWPLPRNGPNWNPNLRLALRNGGTPPPGWTSTQNAPSGFIKSDGIIIGWNGGTPPNDWEHASSTEFNPAHTCEHSGLPPSTTIAHSIAVTPPDDWFRIATPFTWIRPIPHQTP